MKPAVTVRVPMPEYGDSLMTLPAIARLCEERPVHLKMQNLAVAALVPGHPNLAFFGDGPVETITLDVHEGVRRWNKNMHPTAMFMRLAGFEGYDAESPSLLPVVTLSTQQRVDEFLGDFLDRCHEPTTEYDFLFAPFSRDMKQRGWDLWDYPSFFDGLRLLYPGCTIGILGSATDRKAWDGTLAGVRKVEGLDYLYGYSLSDVIRLLKACNIAVVTIDSAVSRLCHAAEIDNHILMCSNVVPARWACHPKATVLYGKRGAGEVWGMALRIIRDGFPAEVSA